MTRSDIEQQLFACVEDGFSQCRDSIDKVVSQCVPVKQDTKRKQKLCDNELEDAKGKQVLLRDQLSKSTEDLIFDADKLHRDGTLYRSNNPITLPYVIKENYCMEDTAKKKLSEEIRDVVLKHLQSTSFMPTLGNVELSRSQNVIVGVNLFRKSVPSGLKMASCNAFLCLGYLEEEKLRLEFIPRDSDKGSVRFVDCPSGVFSLLSSEDGVLVKTNDRKCHVYQSVDGEPIELECLDIVIGFVKDGEQFVTLSMNRYDSSLKWMPANILPDINARMFCPDNSKIVKIDNNPKYSMIVCLWETSDSDICVYFLDQNSSWVEKRLCTGYAIGRVLYRGLSRNRKTFIFNLWIRYGDEFQLSVVNMLITDVNVTKSKIFSVPHFKLSEKVIDLIVFDKSCYMKTKSNQILKIDKYLNALC